MAVKDDIYYPTEDLILSKPRRHFRTTVNAVHWQLRSLIGAEKDNYVYFATGKGSLNVQRLNRKTHETETLKRLSFQPRCLVARNGWVCCGGETGEFSAIHVGNENTGPEQATSASLDPDDRLPLELDPSRPEESIFASLARLRPEKNLLAPSKKIGKERVNCITLWFPPDLVTLSDGAYSGPVAVLSNNDKTVSVVALWGDQEVVDDLTYPDPVNRAVISPDGRLLVAVSDDPYLYVHERVEKPTPSSNSFRTADRPVYEWKLCAKIHLKSQRKEDRTDSSFAACFSSTGRFLAVGTQYGTISIFNVAAFTETDVDPLITWFRSSRTYAELGAVRDMAFAPGPIDLLAWTEDRGRVGVADLRSGFVSRQIIHLDKLDDYEHINVVEVPLERGFIDPRLLETRGERSEAREALSSTFALDLSLEGRESRANRRPEARELPGRFYDPGDDTQVLEAFQDQRRRREQQERERAAAQAAATPGPRLWAERSTRPSESSRASERSASATRAVNDILGNVRDHRERIRDGQERLRATMRDADSSAADRDRRRGTFNSSTTGSARTTPSTSMSTAASQESERRALVSRLIANSPPGVSSGLENLEALYENDPTLPRRSFFAFTRDGDADIRRWRLLRAAYLVRDIRDWENESPIRRTNISGYGIRNVAADPYDTSGLAWSDDGQILYVGSENGIYELHVNVCGRRLFPSIGFR
ncbi:hypothetical protein V8F20_003583 [Naviculisporaceae sp. PSN 640]